MNQYVSASRKLFSVLLSFLMFGRPFYLLHAIGFTLFLMACALRVMTTREQEQRKDRNTVKECDDEEMAVLKHSDTDSDPPESGQKEEGEENSLEERKHNGKQRAKT